MFATEVPGELLQVAGNIVALFLVLSFGWLGLPGEYMAFGWAIKEVPESHRPSEEKWHDEVPFRCDLLMDDDVLVEPLLGVRPWMAGHCAEEAPRAIWGPQAINEEKTRVEGQRYVEQIVWGSP